MTRILMVLDREFPPDIRVENEIDALLKAGFEVHIACYTRKNKPAYEVAGKLTIHRKAISPFVYKSSVACLTAPLYFCFWKKFILEILKKHTFDFIHIHDLPLAKVGRYFRRKHNLRLIVDLHENWPAFVKISEHTRTIQGRLVSPVFLWKIYERRILKSADGIVVVVDEAKDRLLKFRLPESRIHVVSNTANLEAIEIKTPGQHQDIILYYAGGINYHRGLQKVVQAIHISKNPQIKFWILGDGSYKKTLTDLVNELGLNDQVIFKGYQPFQKVMEMLGESDYALIPHLKNEHTDSTIPHKLFQYMYLAKPVIASDCLPIKRIIEETGAGFVYPAYDAEYLGNLLNNLKPQQYQEMAENGKKAVLQKYNWSNDSKVLIEMYQNLAE